MRRVNDLFKELGFNKECSEETQKAFVRHLMRVANVSQFQRKTKSITDEPEQLSFDFEKAEENKNEQDLTSKKKTTQQVG